ncbi:MAG: peptide-methionine (R)-S-oxide reductase MsrB [Spirochaetales bacterium]|nr:peptide-methionine (R)-S-oxide reductase MsrB [Spirochaetales bacterium]
MGNERRPDGRPRFARNLADLARELDGERYRVLVEGGTEPPFRNAYWDEKGEGLYVDAIDGTPLFTSLDKFDSGCGWPSFTAPVEPEGVELLEDRSHGMTRTEVRSASSGGHLGHVFDDGPGPRGERWCINSASLRFVPASELEKEGYGRFAALFGGRNGRSGG